MQIRYGPNMSKHSRSFVPQRVCRGCSFILDEPDHQPERCSIAIVTSRSYTEISFLPSFAVNPSGSGGSSYETPHFAPLLVVKALCLAGALSRYRPPVWLSRGGVSPERSEEHTSELQSLMRISYAVFCLKKKKK